MERKIIISTIILFIILIIISAGTVFFIKNSELNPDKYIARVVQNAKIIDANIDHNQALDVIEYAQKQGIKPPSILINFDTHSDIYVNRKISKEKGAQIEDWINEYIAKNDNVDTVYWVMPKEEALELILRYDFGEHDGIDIAWGIPVFGNVFKPDMVRFLFLPLTVKSYTQKFLINPKNSLMNEYVEGYEYNNLLFEEKTTKFKEVTLITCTEETLPNFKGKDVFLSIDADYMSNSGFDTGEDFEIRKTPQGLEETFLSMMKTIDKKNIRPQIISLTLSPEYLPSIHHNHVIDLFEKILIVASLPDALLTYTRFNNHEEDEGYNSGKSFRHKSTKN